MDTCEGLDVNNDVDLLLANIIKKGIQNENKN